MAKILKKTEVILNGRGRIMLNPLDHVITGGEGSVYRKNDTIIKLYTDPRKMLNDRMADKIKQLACCRHEFIVLPTDIVKDAAQNPIGFYMPFVDGEPISRVFTNDFRLRNRFSDDDANTLVNHMRTTVEQAHQNGAILVDPNEMNWLVVHRGAHNPEPRIIDVDGWSIGRWQNRAIMPSIRDWHTPVFNEMSDWFSWGIVTFQVYTGLHPYKGKLPGYTQHDLEKRMKENASVFRKEIRLNQAVRDFSCIPPILCDWYEDEFAKQKRSVPPSPFDAGKIVSTKGRVARAKGLAGGGILVFEKLCEAKQQVLRIFTAGVALLDNGDLVELGQGKVIGNTQAVQVSVTIQDDGWLIVEYEKEKLICRQVNQISLKQEMLDCNVSARGLLGAGSRTFAITDRGLTELVRVCLGKKQMLSVGNTWRASPNATKWFDAVGVEDIFGTKHLVLPFGDKACATVRAKELDGLVLVTASAGSRYVSVIALDQKGLYQKFEFSFDSAYSRYALWRNYVDSADLILSILPKGVCATIVSDGTLDIFVPSAGTQKKVLDPLIKTGTLLAEWNNNVVYADKKTIWRIKMK